MTDTARLEAHCRLAFGGSWDGYVYLKERREHFTEAEKARWREVYRPVIEDRSTA